MPPSDLDITRTGHLWIQQHGDDATAKARQKVDEMRRKHGRTYQPSPAPRAYVARATDISVNLCQSGGAAHETTDSGGSDG
jgi:hypothetical protein